MVLHVPLSYVLVLRHGKVTVRVGQTIVFFAMSAAVSVASMKDPRQLERGGRDISTTLIRASEFVEVRHVNSRPDCEEVRPPEELTTPDPLFTAGSPGRRVKVSFIIGTDGRVHAPLILESGGMAGDRRVLQTVRGWRYRPAMCNGVPTETEGKVEFSIR